MKSIKFMMAMLISVFTGIGIVKAADASAATVQPNKFTITRTINNVTNAVTNTFTYTITPDADNPSGGATGVPTSATVVFNNVTPTQSNTAVQTGEIDLSGASFSKVGNYKFLVTETASTKASNYPVDSTDKYVIQVSVRFDTTNPTEKVLTINATSGEGTSATKLSTANFPFASGSSLSYLSLTKQVSGNMADMEKCFKFKVNVNGGGSATYIVNGQTCDEASTTVQNGGYVYVKHGETITIGKNGNDGQLPIGATYTLVEEDADDYATTITGATSSGATNKTAQGTIGAINSITFNNTWDEDTLTGIFLKVLPYVVVIAIAVAGIVYMVVKNKKDKLVEE